MDIQLDILKDIQLDIHHTKKMSPEEDILKVRV
jgi:hypothetical protein